VSFFFPKTEQEAKTGPLYAGGAHQNERREDIRKGCRRVNMVGISYIHVLKWKNETC
jgi:hypothetical protein